MAFKCSVCGIQDVNNEGEVCELCAITHDPYANKTTSGTPRRISLNTTDNSPEQAYIPSHKATRKVLIKDSSSQDDISVVESAPISSHSFLPQNNTTPIKQASLKGRASKAAVSGPITTGIVKNVTFTDEKRSILKKLYRCAFKGEHFTWNNDITSFQVFPDFSGATLNAQGYYCDQVVIYGHLTKGAVSENNDIQVFGHRNNQNIIVADKIVNTATGAEIKTDHKLSSAFVWLIISALILMCAGIVKAEGPSGLFTVAIIIVCLTNLPLVFKIAMMVLKLIWSILEKSMFR